MKQCRENREGYLSVGSFPGTARVGSGWNQEPDMHLGLPHGCQESWYLHPYLLLPSVVAGIRLEVEAELVARHADMECGCPDCQCTSPQHDTHSWKVNIVKFFKVVTYLVQTANLRFSLIFFCSKAWPFMPSMLWRLLKEFMHNLWYNIFI